MEIMPGVCDYDDNIKNNDNYKNINLIGTETLNIFRDFHSNKNISTGIETFDLLTGLNKSSMDQSYDQQMQPQKGAPYQPIISKIPNSNIINYYLNAATNISEPTYINNLCIALNCCTKNDELHLYLGSALDDTHTINISAIIYAIQNSKSTIYTHAYGYCSIPETMIWAYGTYRDIGDYGAIKFGGGEWIRRMSTAFTPYINTYLKHCQNIGILTESMIEDIVVKQKEYMFIKDLNTNELISI